MKQQQLTFEKGMTNVPSDAICSDNALEDSTNMIYRDGEHHVIQRPKLFNGNATMKLVFVHKLGDGTPNYIYEGTENNVKYLYYNSNSNAIAGTEHTTVKSITAIGNTIIASFDGRIWYGLYNGSGYKDITKIPAPAVEFRMGMDSSADPTNYQKGFSVVNSTGSPNGIIGYGPDNQQQYFYIKLDEGGSQEKYNNLVVGLYSKNLTTIKEKMGFAEPFCARVALELYDGSYTCITNPVMLLPAVTKNSSAYNAHNIFTVYTNYSLLYCKLTNDYSDYNDIVKDVVVFISDGVNIYDTTVDQPSDANRRLYEASSSDVLTNCVAYNTNDGRSKLTQTTKGDARRWMVLKERPKKEIEDDLARQSTFYRLCSLGTSEMNNFAGVADKIGVHTLETLTTQEQLQYDDFYSFCPLKADFLYSYNNRLNAAGIKRGFFEGFDFFIAYDKTITSNYTAYVTIKTPEGEIVVSHQYSTQQQQGIWFYYPDPRASHVYIDNGGSCVCDADLTEHPGLNGAFYFKGLLTVEATPTGTHTAPTATVSPQENLGNYLLTSEVNNPFIFRASGYNRVGAGAIFGMAAQTQALSQGQFGQYPLLVFTTEGIWAMSLNNTGLFTAIHPMSREVALESNPAITPVDGAVFFVSKKGLMVVEGNKVVCVSEQLNNKVFPGGSSPNIYDIENYFKNCYIAYDYRDSLLWIFNDNMMANGALVYSIKSGTYGLADLLFEPLCVVNNYPDYLVQAQMDDNDKFKIYTLYGRSSANRDADIYSCFLKSRPMKLENGLALKRIIQMKHIKNMDDTYTTTSGTPPVTTTHPTLVFSMEGSNNAKDWCQLTSLRSIPWKYYRFAYTFEHLKATDTFAGTVIVTEEVRTNKLR